MDIICQNCYKVIGQKIEDNGIKYVPYEINSLSQEIDKDTVLKTLQCPKCGCCVQIKV